MSPIASDDDQAIGEAVTRLRGNRSQQWVAERMRELNPRWKWSQATLWSIEKGERPLRLAEARDLAAVLQVDVRALIDPMPDARSLTKEQLKAMRDEAQHELDVAGLAVVDASEDVDRARAALDEATGRLHSARATEAQALDRHTRIDRLAREARELGVNLDG